MCGYDVPPNTAELNDLMQQAARRNHEAQCVLDRARPWSERYDHSAWIDSVLEAQRRGQRPPQHVDDADDDGCDDEYGDFQCMHDDDEYGQNLPELTAEDACGASSRRPRKRESAPELLSAHICGYRVQLTAY